ncbi:MAG: PmeII family type II restriction endonuclease [Candidatus Cloacimonadaceae bacterium]|nr:PmeII family type II restriction endonuclease [Candidatus Cloacimonadaceae bacterium]
MTKKLIKAIEKYVKDNIQKFHDSRIQALSIINVAKLLKKKNPYLYKVKNSEVASDLVKGILDAHLSSSEETMFGDWLEGLAIFINKMVYNGSKSSACGIDLEFEKEGVRYLVCVKSGPNWGNSGQVKKMKDNFEAATITLKTSGSKIRVDAVNGCCYGTSKETLRVGNYYKICGQSFWTFISGDENLYIDIIKPLGSMAKERNAEFIVKYEALLNKLTIDFGKVYCNKNGSINWEKIVKLSCEKKKPSKRKTKSEV